MNVGKFLVFFTPVWFLLNGYWIYSIPFLATFIATNKIKVNFSILFISFSFITLVIISNVFGQPQVPYASQFEHITYLNSDNIFIRYVPTVSSHQSSLISMITYALIIMPFGYFISSFDEGKLSKNFICLVISILFIQTVLFYFLGYRSDIAIGVDTSRSFYFGDYRPSAFFFEPKDAATAIFIGCLSLMYKKAYSKFFLLLCLVGILLTKSAAGYFIYVPILLFLSYYLKVIEFKRNDFYMFTLILLPVSLISLPLLSARFIDGVDGSFLYKITTLTNFINFDLSRQIFGSGLGNNDCYCLGTDVAFIWTLIYQGGIFGLLFIILAAFSMVKKNNIKSGLLIISLMTSPVPLTLPLVWFFIGYIIRDIKRNSHSYAL